ncbi:hypothetical protein GGQ92_000692 [Gracilibacillus halotolerans]|uniref:DUF1266 domain-containing protein n=1 Tax=Gracilibacillus halotolerans TaxID=74386 RepID=A0A841RL58_9BACI|nr:DUF1266 domain-containing protein [Gracilibacillus halotolerans]MBB6511925.1 hypothetical protein [Gracilibacillus halotolerans]
MKNLFATAILSFNYEGDMFTFASHKKKHLSKRLCKEIVEGSNIRDKETFLSISNWFLEEGPRYSYNKELNKFKIMSPNALESFLIKHEQSEKYEFYKHVIQNIHRIPPGSILAFDMANLFLFIYASRRLNIIGQKEEEIVTNQAIELLQLHYSDWTEFIYGVSLAKRNISLDLNNSYVWDNKLYLRHWVYSKISPFNKIKW